jgi:glycosyltransferase involved in cell wall biosynthesis
MRKRVLVFIEDGTFTYDNRVIRETSALIKEGWEVVVISQKGPSDPFYRRINEKLWAYFFPKPTAEGVLGHVFEHSISLVVGSLLTLCVYLRHRFSVFHACNPMDILWLVALPYKLLGVKFIYDQHDLCPELFLSREDGDTNSLFYRILLLLERLSYRMANSVIVTNESYKEIAVERGSKEPSDVFVVRNGPDLNQFKPTLANPDIRRQARTVVGYLGNMNHQDGVNYLIEAANEIVNRRKRSDISFVLIGGGSVQESLARTVAEMGLEKRVLFTGRMKPDREMMAVLSACDICVQPDPLNPLNDKSTMCKAMEYMALGKPVIAFDLKETRVSCGDAAMYVTPNDWVELADKIILLAERDDIRDRMAKAGRRRIETRLSWDSSVPNLLRAYKNALGR